MIGNQRPVTELRHQRAKQKDSWPGIKEAINESAGRMKELLASKTDPGPKNLIRDFYALFTEDVKRANLGEIQYAPTRILSRSN